MQKGERFVTQTTSARWLLTVIAGLCLLILTATNCRRMLEDKEPLVSNEAIFSVITMVFVSYFQKQRKDAEPKV